jgi:hypothetical protein
LPSSDRTNNKNPRGLEDPAGLLGERMSASISEEEKNRIAEAVPEECLRAALEVYERAGLADSCDEGRWEMAIDAIRSLNLHAITAGEAFDVGGTLRDPSPR